MAKMQARLGVPLYCGACASTMVQIKRADIGNIATAECRNPNCDFVGKLFMAPTVQLEEIIQVRLKPVQAAKDTKAAEASA
jgi:hypothetical protein